MTYVNLFNGSDATTENKLNIIIGSCKRGLCTGMLKHTIRRFRQKLSNIYHDVICHEWEFYDLVKAFNRSS